MTKDEVLQELQQTLADMVDSLEPAPYQPTDNFEYRTIDFDGTEKDNTHWLDLIAMYIATAETFEIHCWAEETDAIALALQYGSVKPTNWRYGTVITGEVTAEFASMLLSLPKPTNTDNGYNMMTPFFTIMFDNGFSSEHYGTENIIKIGKIL